MNVASPVTPPSASQILRLAQYRDELCKRVSQLRENASELESLVYLVNMEPPSAADADASELTLLRALVESTRPSPLHFSAL